MYVSLSLHSASFFDAVQDLELGEYDFFDETVRLGREHLSSRVFFQRLDARLVRQKSVVQYVELVVEHAQRVTLYTNNEKNKYRGNNYHYHNYHEYYPPPSPHKPTIHKKESSITARITRTAAGILRSRGHYNHAAVNYCSIYL